MSEARSISGTTRFCAVYGHPVKHSASPAMHNAAMERMGLDWRYLAFDVHPERLAAAFQGAQAMKFCGVNLTVPHKLLAVELMDELDHSAREWGAVNTVLFEGRIESGEWKRLGDCAAEQVSATRMRGFNTDADAIRQAIEEDLGIQLKGASVLLLGAGGAGRTAALKLAHSGIRELYLVNRTRSKAEAIAREIEGRGLKVALSQDYPQTRIDLVVNATSLGLAGGDPLPYDPAVFSLKEAAHAYDMIYRPAVTPFLAEAERAGCKTANGLGMLLYQGAKALEIWTGRSAPVEVMRRALHEHIYPVAIEKPAKAA